MYAMKSTTTASYEALTAQYHRDGYCIVPAAIGDEECDILKVEALRVLREQAPSGASVYVGCAVVSKVYEQLASDPRVIEVLRPIMPGGVMFMSDKFVFKSKDKTFASPWHIDAYYWPGTRPKLSVWIPLDDVDAGNGTLQVIPGSHLKPWARADGEQSATNGEFANVVRDQTWKPDEVVTCSVPRGSLVIFSDLLVHGSCPNTSGRDRYTIISTYHAPAADEEFDKGFAARRVIVPG